MSTENEKQTVAMSTEEMAEFQAYKEHKAKEDAIHAAKEARETYSKLVDDEVFKSIPLLLSISECIKDTKSSIYANFEAILDMKAEVLKLTKDNQRTHTFTHSNGKMRLTLGVYVVDAYRDTVNDGIQIVKEYIESLAKDADSRALVNAVLRLLSKDTKGDLKASRVLQLRKMADDSENERFIEGVRIIEESYQPAISKTFIKAEQKDESGKWNIIPLGMTEAS